MILYLAQKTVMLPHTRPANHVLPRLRISESEIPNAGLGLFAVSCIQAGALVDEYKGKLLDRKQADEMNLRGTDTHVRAIRLGYEYVDGLGVSPIELATVHGTACFANDPYGSGKPPNVEYWTYDHLGGELPDGTFTTARVFLRAITAIEPGDEILVHYGRTYHDKHFQ